MAKTYHDGIAVANDAVRCAAYNLETIVVLLNSMDAIKVSGPSLADLMRPIVSDLFVAHEELVILAKEAV